MPSTREQLLERIRKLRLLADDVAGTPEGRAAKRKVLDLMKRYGLSGADVWPKSAPPVHHDVKPPARRRASAASSTSPPATITFKAGNLRIRWRL